MTAFDGNYKVFRDYSEIILLDEFCKSSASRIFPRCNYY